MDIDCIAIYTNNSHNNSKTKPEAASTNSSNQKQVNGIRKNLHAL